MRNVQVLIPGSGPRGRAATEKANAALGQVTNWDEILKAHNKEVRKNPAFAGGDLPVTAGASDDENADEMAKLLEKYKKAKNKVRRLKEELQIVHELNRDLQRAWYGKKNKSGHLFLYQLLHHLLWWKGPHKQLQPLAQRQLLWLLKHPLQQALLMNFTNVGVQLQKKAWNNAMDPKIGASVAVKNLATSVWGSDVLLTRTVTGVLSNANKDKEPRPLLTPKKVAFLRENLATVLQLTEGKPKSEIFYQTVETMDDVKESEKQATWVPQGLEILVATSLDSIFCRLARTQGGRCSSPFFKAPSSKKCWVDVPFTLAMQFLRFP
ncbi:hypothetical protein HPB47_017803 [Ixodes persulcatus]|uniref:Uncharacterized protein n=1 Tax=Ixodes persulcatus TaxID=34615 RepID=A0AC60QMD4_IXOPE|nr:hypothetical protein HPB47_017803 [Ixodes persulcatus]